MRLTHPISALFKRSHKLVVPGLQLASHRRRGNAFPTPHQRPEAFVAQRKANRGGADAPAPRGPRGRGLRPRTRLQVKRVHVLQELLAVVILAADDVHHAVLDHGRVEPALRRGQPFRVNAAPHHVSRVAQISDVRRRGRVRRAPARVVPHAASPDPHLLVRIEHRGMFVSAHGEVACDFGVKKLKSVQVEGEELADVETQPAFHDEASENKHHVFVGNHRGRG
mmetsp:Transcript_11186/g.41450  ORF Transcript_11186/g.41450 Transcript_11186/m.41450 type:complete len:224 (-) Transcript_11186:1107-1778(-)